MKRIIRKSYPFPFLDLATNKTYNKVAVYYKKHFFAIPQLLFTYKISLEKDNRDYRYQIDIIDIENYYKICRTVENFILTGI